MRTESCSMALPISLKHQHGRSCHQGLRCWRGSPSPSWKPNSNDQPAANGPDGCWLKFRINTNPAKEAVASLVKQYESAALKQLSDAIDKHETASRYCCGRRVATSLNAKIRWEALEVLESDSDHRLSPPDLKSYILRFDDPVDKGISRQVLFPMKKEKPKEAWSHFVMATQASEGLGFLSSKQFSIDFDPHRSGLLDGVEQIMLPGLSVMLWRVTQNIVASEHRLQHFW